MCVFSFSSLFEVGRSRLLCLILQFLSFHRFVVNICDSFHSSGFYKKYVKILFNVFWCFFVKVLLVETSSEKNLS